jgi:hypothetical protein
MVVLPLIFGIIILAILVYIGIRIFKNLVVGILLIALVLIVSFLILGSFPDLQSIPFIGKYLPKIPSTTGEAISAIRKFFYSLEIVNVARDNQNNLLITVANTGKLSLSNFKVFVDGEYTPMINKPKDPLNSGEITVLQVDWKGNFNKILVQTGQANALFSSE